MTDQRAYHLELVGFAAFVVIFWAALIVCAAKVLA